MRTWPLGSATVTLLVWLFFPAIPAAAQEAQVLLPRQGCTGRGADGANVPLEKIWVPIAVLKTEGDWLLVAPKALVNRRDVVPLAAAIAYYDQLLAQDAKDAFALCFRGLAHLLSGDPKTAERDLTKSLELQPGNAHALHIRGITWNQLGDVAKALADFDAAIQANAENAQALVNRAEMYNALGKYNEAVADCNTALKTFARFHDAFAQRGFAYAQSNRPEHAIQDFDQAILLSPKDAKSLRHRAALRNRMGDRDAALVDIGRAIELEPKTPQFRYERATIYMNVRKREEALADLNACLELDPKMLDALFARSALLWQLERLDEALSDASRAINSQPDRAGSYVVRASCYEAMGRFAEAIVDFDAAIKLAPHLPQAWHGRSMVRRRLGQLDQAVQDANEAIRLDPNYLQGLCGRGQTRRLRGDLRGAVADFDEAIRLDPSFADGYRGRAAVFLLIWNVERAKTDVQRAVELEPKSTETLWLKAYADEHQGRYESAISGYEATLEQNPQFVEAYRRLPIVYVMGNQLDAGINYFTKRLTDKPTHSESLGARAYLWFGKLDLSRAKEDAERALEQDAKQPLAHLVLGALSCKRQDLLDARQHLDQCLAIDAYFPDATFLRANLNYAEAQYDAALKDIARALDLAPYNESLLYLRVDVLIVLHQDQAAIEAANEFIALLPKSSLAYILRAEARTYAVDPALRNGKLALQDATQGYKLEEKKSSRAMSAIAASYAMLAQWDKAVQWQQSANKRLTTPAERDVGNKLLSSYQRQELPVAAQEAKGRASSDAGKSKSSDIPSGARGK
ncbi:MAG: tetratricopeptide repeat protein [Pirellulales bacterium]|nr:tetratricopeptide repeat protein [Pirellulales bacterium]